MCDSRILQRKQEQDGRRKSGRPLKNPFHQKLVEEDFGLRARNVVQRYFDSSPENTKKPFVLPDGVRMGKTLFWAAIFYYYTLKEMQPAERDYCPLFPDEERPLLDDNLDHFLRILREQVGEQAVSNRASISKLVQKLASITIGFLGQKTDGNPLRNKETNKYRLQYHTILKCWMDI